MRFLRHKRILQIISTLTIVGFSLSLFTTVADASVVVGRYGDWLRLQLPADHLPEIDMAIEAAELVSTASLDEFLSVFLVELESLTDESSPTQSTLAKLLGSSSSDPDLLLKDLLSRFDDHFSMAVMSRSLISMMTANSSLQQKGEQKSQLTRDPENLRNKDSNSPVCGGFEDQPPPHFSFLRFCVQSLGP
jgi:hypothetical protein